MPEIKHTFTSGRMNKDLDERLVPNGEYRDAQNVEVLTSEDSNAGTVQTCLGNSLVSNLTPDDESICVGSIADDKTNNIYYLVAGNPASENISSDMHVFIDRINNVRNVLDGTSTGGIEYIKAGKLKNIMENISDPAEGLGNILLDGQQFNRFQKYITKRYVDDMILNDPKLSQFVLKGFQMDMFGAKPKKTSILWSSPTQVGKVLKVLDPKIENTNMRELYKRQYKFPLIKVLIDYRKKAKLVTTYGKDFLKYVNKTSQKVHTLFWQILNTGRVSSGQTRSKNNPHQAPNMQNIPADNVYRNCFMAEEGWKIVTMDYSGQELRLIAEGSKDPTWIQAFKNNEDVHGKVASLIFKIDESEVRDKPEFLRGKSYRDVAKTINFGLAYGMSYMKLADTLDISITDAKEFINRYFEALPKIKSFLKLLGNYGKNNGYIKTFAPFRRIRWFEDWASLAGLPHKDKFTRLGEIERASKNTPIQGSGADMIKLALALIIEQINEHKLHNKVKIVSQVHDEISCEVRDDFVALWIELQETLMLKAGRVICKQIDMNVDYSVSDKWSK